MSASKRKCTRRLMLAVVCAGSDKPIPPAPPESEEKK